MNAETADRSPLAALLPGVSKQPEPTWPLIRQPAGKERDRLWPLRWLPMPDGHRRNAIFC